MKISILHPSYGRPELARKCYDEWMGNAARPERIEYILCLSDMDANTHSAGWGYQQAFAGTAAKIVTMAERGLVKQVNHAATVCTGDLIVAVSDDFGCPVAWDEILSVKLAGKSDYAVKTQDGIQPFIMTLPIMDRVFYERLGYIYHPTYDHMYGDEELAEVAKMLGRTVTLEDVFAHRHYSTGLMAKDDVNRRNDSYMMTDREKHKERKRRGYDVKLLSVLIPTLPGRAEMLAGLLKELHRQIRERWPDVELQHAPVEILTDGRVHETIGEKRNALMARATGEYVCYVDDDDMVAEHYLYHIMSGIEHWPDCCMLRGIMTTDGDNPVQLEHSIRHTTYHEKDGVLYRPPNHLNVIRRKIAERYPFANSNWGEDTDWAMRICRDGVLNVEYVIDDVIYWYRYRRNKLQGQ